MTRLESWWSGVLGVGVTMAAGGLSSFAFAAPVRHVTKGLTVWSPKGRAAAVRAADNQEGLLGQPGEASLGGIQ